MVKPAMMARTALVCVLSLLAPTLGASASEPLAVHANVHPGIIIVGDAGFSGPASGVSSGSGTAGDPYMIRDLVVSVATGRGILIQDTRAHVALHNISISGGEGAATSFIVPCAVTADCEATVGIHLKNVSHATIRDVRIDSTFDGIRVVDSEDVRISGGTLGADGAVLSMSNALRVLDSRGVHVSGVTMTNMEDAIDVDRVTNLEIRDSRLTGSPSFIRLDELTGYTFIRNFVRNMTTQVGVGDHFVIHGNDYAGVNAIADGVAIPAIVRNISVCGNTVRNVSGTVLALAGLQELTLEGNDISGGEAVVASSGIVKARIEGNRFSGQSWRSINVDGSTITVHNNDFGSNARALIRADRGDARHNYWGDPSGPSRDGPGSGTEIQAVGNVTFTPWLTSAPARATTCDRSPPSPVDPATRHIKAYATSDVEVSETVHETFGPASLRAMITARANVGIERSIALP